MIRAVVVEEEPLARRQLSRLLTVTGKVEVVGEAEDARTGLHLCRSRHAEAAFVDIELPGPSGLTLGAALEQFSEPPLCVFVTRSAHFAVDAFEVHAADYLLKPIDPARLERTVEHLCRRVQERHALPQTSAESAEDRLPVRRRDQDVARLLTRQEIVAVLRKGRRTWIHTRDTEYPTYLPVSRLEAWLGGEPFLRAARDAVVNLDEVAEIIHFGDRLYRLCLKDRRHTVVKASRSAASHLAHCLRIHLDGRPDSQTPGEEIRDQIGSAAATGVGSGHHPAQAG